MSHGPSHCPQPLHRKVHKAQSPILQRVQGVKPILVGEAQQHTFDDLKAHLQHPATLSSPKPGAPLFLYITATGGAVSGPWWKDTTAPTAPNIPPVYYVTEALSGAKVRYAELEKMIYAIVMATGS